MSRRNSKSSKIFKSVLIILCVIIVIVVFWVGLRILLTENSDESTPKEKDVESILSFIKKLSFLLKYFV
jgi:hypothetical protein